MGFLARALGPPTTQIPDQHQMQTSARSECEADMKKVHGRPRPPAPFVLSSVQYNMNDRTDGRTARGSQHEDIWTSVSGRWNGREWIQMDSDGLHGFRGRQRQIRREIRGLGEDCITEGWKNANR